MALHLGEGAQPNGLVGRVARGRRFARPRLARPGHGLAVRATQDLEPRVLVHVDDGEPPLRRDASGCEDQSRSRGGPSPQWHRSSLSLPSPGDGPGPGRRSATSDGGQRPVVHACHRARGTRSGSCHRSLPIPAPAPCRRQPRQSSRESATAAWPPRTSPARRRRPRCSGQASRGSRPTPVDHAHLVSPSSPFFSPTPSCFGLDATPQGLWAGKTRSAETSHLPSRRTNTDVPRLSRTAPSLKRATVSTMADSGVRGRMLVTVRNLMPSDAGATAARRIEARLRSLVTPGAGKRGAQACGFR